MDDIQQAESGVWRAICTALLIELVIAVGVLAGMLLVAWWPGGTW